MLCIFQRTETSIVNYFETFPTQHCCGFIGLKPKCWMLMVCYVHGKVSSVLLEWLQWCRSYFHHLPVLSERWMHRKSCMLSCWVIYWDVPYHFLMLPQLDGCRIAFLNTLKPMDNVLPVMLKGWASCFFAVCSRAVALDSKLNWLWNLGHLGRQYFLQNLCT